MNNLEKYGVVELKQEELMKIEGGWKGWKSDVAVAGATVALFAAPFTGGISLGVLAFGMFVLACNTHG